jgi:D-psicose/D-tagatose/L-ribulose 3-epimerase
MMNIFIHLDTYHMNIEEVSTAKGFVDAGTHLGYGHVSEPNPGAHGRGYVGLGWQLFGAQVGRVGWCVDAEKFVYLASEIASGLGDLVSGYGRSCKRD